MLNSIFTPFQYEFFRNGMLAGIMIGALCGLLGVYIVLRGMSYIGHGLSHAIFGGAAVAYVMNFDLNLWAGFWGFLAAILISWTVRRYKISADAAIGVITTASFAIGVAVISGLHRFTRSIEGFLFGSILGVTPTQLLTVLIVTIVVAIFIFIRYKQLLFTTFDEETAHVYGIRTGLVDNMFSLALAAALVVSMQVIGVTLIAAAIVIPPITARLLTNRFDHMLILATLLGAITAAIGIWASFPLDVAAGASIVLVQASVFVIALVINAALQRNRMALASVHDHHL
jgi:manganese/iron transport system permease protein/iron/zinc/copper transport system permease protein